MKSEVASNAQTYDDCIRGYEEEMTALRDLVAGRDRAIEGLESNSTIEKVRWMESQIERLTKELEEERNLGMNFAVKVSTTTKDLEEAKRVVTLYEKRLALLDNETLSYRSQLSCLQEQIQTLEKTKMDLEKQRLRYEEQLESQKEQSTEALERRDTQIALLTRELAEKYNEVHTAGLTLKEVKARLERMNYTYGNEKRRADALDEELQALRQNLPSKNETATLKEISRIADAYEEMSRTAAHHKSRITTLEDKIRFIKQQLLLSSQIFHQKQSEISRLKEELAHAKSSLALTMEDDSSASRRLQAKANEKIILKNQLLKEQEDAITKADIQAEKHFAIGKYHEAAMEEKDAIISSLKANVEDLKSTSSLWKAKANEKILLTTRLFKDEEAKVLELQSGIEKLIAEKEILRKDLVQQSTLEKEISGLKATLQQLRESSSLSRSRAKEKILLKNQSLKEKDDIIAALTTKTEILRREKDDISDRWKEEIRLRSNDHVSHEMQLQAMQDKLAKEHRAAMANMEKEMSETVYELEMEIQSLKKKSSNEDEAVREGSIFIAQNEQTFKLQEMEEAIRRSKRKEIALLNQNLMLKKLVEDLKLKQSQKDSSLETGDGHSEEDSSRTIELPPYYKEKTSSLLIRVVGKVWTKLFRRKKL